MFTYEMFLPLLKPLFSLVFVIVGLMALRFMIYYINFNHSEYRIASGNNFIKTIFNKGNNGEYLTFRYLEKLGGNNKLLTNIYLPKEDGSTTEIDLLMINRTGMYVFESKNYSGWIFGDEKNKNWTQSLNGGKKYKFLNPVWQNKVHISALSRILSDVDSSSIYSYIIFSERCELKNVKITSENVKILKRNKLLSYLKKNINANNEIFTEEQIESYYKVLVNYCLADDLTKQVHIQKINEKFKKER